MTSGATSFLKKFRDSRSESSGTLGSFTTSTSALSNSSIANIVDVNTESSNYISKYGFHKTSAVVIQTVNQVEVNFLNMDARTLFGGVEKHGECVYKNMLLELKTYGYIKRLCFFYKEKIILAEYAESPSYYTEIPFDNILKVYQVDEDKIEGRDSVFLITTPKKFIYLSASSPKLRDIFLSYFGLLYDRSIRWQVNELFSKCLLCDQRFTLFNRRCVCKGCFRYICNSCTTVKGDRKFSKQNRFCRECLTTIEKMEVQNKFQSDFLNFSKYEADSGAETMDELDDTEYQLEILRQKSRSARVHGLV